MTYAIGQEVPWVQRPPLWRDDGPRWYPLITAPQAELPVSAWLWRNGAEEAWYPTREHRTTINRGKKRVIVRMVPEWPRYIFALCPGSPVSWDDLIERSNRKLVGVVTVNGAPAIIDDDALLAMQDVPNTLRAIRQARLEAQRIRKGDSAVILDGEMKGWEITVSDVDGEFAAFMIPLLGGAMSRIEVGRLKKVGP